MILLFFTYCIYVPLVFSLFFFFFFCFFLFYFFFFFFFQAEDGIRDGHVTGVQTCALPISRGRARGGSRGLAPHSRKLSAAGGEGLAGCPPSWARAQRGRRSVRKSRAITAPLSDPLPLRWVMMNRVDGCRCIRPSTSLRPMCIAPPSSS